MTLRSVGFLAICLLAANLTGSFRCTPWGQVEEIKWERTEGVEMREVKEEEE